MEYVRYENMGVHIVFHLILYVRNVTNASRHDESRNK